MATAKKVVKKKSVPTKSAKKKPTVAKKVTPAPHKAKKATTASAVSDNSFWQVKFTINTVYWLIIGAAVIATAFITYNTNVQLNELYDSIDAQNARLDELEL